MGTRRTTEKEKTASVIRALLGRLAGLAVPYAWFRCIPNHTAVVLLADILSAYSAQTQEQTVVWDADELLLDYPALASRFDTSDRTISRAVDLLVKRGLVHRTLGDRVVGGTKKRNIVGRRPTRPALAATLVDSKLSGLLRLRRRSHR